jgi:hypothetical protein
MAATKGRQVHGGQRDLRYVRRCGLGGFVGIFVARHPGCFLACRRADGLSSMLTGMAQRTRGVRVHVMPASMRSALCFCSTRQQKKKSKTEQCSESCKSVTTMVKTAHIPKSDGFHKMCVNPHSCGAAYLNPKKLLRRRDDSCTFRGNGRRCAKNARELHPNRRNTHRRSVQPDTCRTEITWSSGSSIS